MEVTWPDLIQFCMFLVGLISLIAMILSNNKK